MRFALFAVLVLLPGLAAAQPTLRLDVGMAYTDPNEPYAELSLSSVTPLQGPVVATATLSATSRLYDVVYAPQEPGPDIDPGFFGSPVLVDRWTALALGAGVRLGSDRMAFQATAGPVFTATEKTGDDVVLGAGVGAEVGLVDVYPIPAFGLGLSVHGATTTSHSWAGVRLGLRARL